MSSFEFAAASQTWPTIPGRPGGEDTSRGGTAGRERAGRTCSSFGDRRSFLVEVTENTGEGRGLRFDFLMALEAARTASVSKSECVRVHLFTNEQYMHGTCMCARSMPIRACFLLVQICVSAIRWHWCSYHAHMRAYMHNF